MAGQDADTIRAVLDGDVGRYAELVDRYQGPALRLAFSLLGDYEDAKDASQDAFLSAYRALGRFRGRAKFSTWLFRIVVNKCKDARRRSARQPPAAARIGEPAAGDEASPGLFVEAADAGAGPSERLAERELSRRLSLAIGQLPMKQRAAFLLHHVHGLPLEEAAGVMGCRLGTVKAHIFRATSSLRAQLAPWQAKEQA
jgi:RNA polymerase sigma-70 factor (ECF subfamily)